VEALRNRVLDALNVLPDVMCALAYRMNELDVPNVLPDVMCALAYRMSVLDEQDDRCAQGVMCALACRMYVLVEQGVLLSDALDVRCALKQILLRVTLASRP
jgi:hypothetical protein